MIGVGDFFPEFKCNGVNDKNEMIEVNDLNEGWTIYYFYPKDFTFICPTEILEMDRLVDEGVNVIGFSGDNEFCKLAWKKDNDLIRNIRHTLAADSGLELSGELGVVDQHEQVCLRATYIVDPENTIQSITVNALDTGRNVDETIRTLKALQAGGLTGCGWTEGESFVA
jgi:peroxiredoxin (alkyl hydroperoxide reductase subunit C)|tara:strand:- start:2282 stop:2788 length:507 start_codon:yes stop_codon:yes gene_type:complete